jgi:hypothetical protein
LSYLNQPQISYLQPRVFTFALFIDACYPLSFSF